MGSMEGADKEDAEAYQAFVLRQLADIFNEMKDEFVGEGYLKDDEYIKYFEEGSLTWREIAKTADEIEAETPETEGSRAVEEWPVED